MGPCRHTDFLIVYTVSSRTGEYALLLVAQMTNMNRDEPNASFKDNQTDKGDSFSTRCPSYKLRLYCRRELDGTQRPVPGRPGVANAEGGPPVPINLVGDGDRCASLGLREHHLADREIIGLAR